LNKIAQAVTVDLNLQSKHCIVTLSPSSMIWYWIYHENKLLADAYLELPLISSIARTVPQ